MDHTRTPMTGLTVGVLAMALIVTAANIGVQIPINDWLTWGAFTYPISFLVTDLCNRAMGPRHARRVVYVGFVFAVALSAYFATPRIAVASEMSSMRVNRPGRAAAGMTSDGPRRMPR